MFILTKGNHAKVGEANDGALLFDTSTGIDYRLIILPDSYEQSVSLSINAPGFVRPIRNSEALDFWSALIDVVEKSNQHNSDYLSVEMNNWLQAAKLRLQGVK